MLRRLRTYTIWASQSSNSMRAILTVAQPTKLRLTCRKNWKMPLACSSDLPLRSII